jgi:hypothetical protein
VACFKNAVFSSSPKSENSWDFGRQCTVRLFARNKALLTYLGKPHPKGNCILTREYVYSINFVYEDGFPSVETPNLLRSRKDLVVWSTSDVNATATNRFQRDRIEKVYNKT